MALFLFSFVLMDVYISLCAYMSESAMEARREWWTPESYRWGGCKQLDMGVENELESLARAANALSC